MMRLNQFLGRRALAWWCGFAILAAMTWAHPAAAQGTAEDYIEPRIDRQQFTALIQHLGLGSDQRTIVELAFSDYTAAMTDLVRQLDAQAVAAGRQKVQDALGGKVRMSTDELNRTRAAVLKIYAQAGESIDQAVADFLASVEIVLTPEQAGAFEAAVKELRRGIYLHPRQSERDVQEYAGDGVDVLVLAQAAVESGGELSAMGLGPLNDILSRYEAQLDDLIVATAGDARQGKLLRKIATLEKDTAAAREREQAALERWKQLYNLNLATVQQIGEVAAAQLDEQARDRWLDRFDQASFAWLYPRKKPDRQIEWIREHSPGPEKLAQAEALYENYLDRRRALSRKAIELMIRGRLEFQTMLYSMMDPSGMDDGIRRSLYQDLLKNSGEQENLENSTSSALEALLQPKQREELREAMKKPDRAGRKRN